MKNASGRGYNSRVSRRLIAFAVLAALLTLAGCAARKPPRAPGDVRFEETGELLLAAATDRLARAVTFVARQLEPVVYLRVADVQQVRQYLQVHYPMPEVPEELIRQARELVYDRR